MARFALLLGLLAAGCRSPAGATAAELSSWNDGATRAAILSFVERVTEPGSEEFVPAPERIAVFDNDGTLWSEQPIYFQLQFALDRVRQLAPDHPEWSKNPALAAAIAGDRKALAATGKKGLLEVVAATHGGMTTAEFEAAAGAWMASAKHPRFHRRYDELVYQPMLELLAYLRANGFKTFIVSGGGIEFMRVFAESVYGIPPEQVVGSRFEVVYELRGDTPVLVRNPKLAFIDDKGGKPVAIQTHIGRRPIFAAGNSDGDYEMLRWATAGKRPGFGLIVRHTDAEREWAYDRDSHIGKLSRALDEAPQRGWTVVDMKRDWKVVYPVPAKR